MRRYQNCLVCQTELKGRSDQKFCSKKCRDTRNNEKYRRRNTVLLDRITQIKKNKRILDEMYSLFGEKPIPIRLFPDNLLLESYTGITAEGNIHVAEYEIIEKPNRHLQIHKHKLK